LEHNLRSYFTILAKASLLRKFVTYIRKKFYNIGHCHYDRKLR